MKFYLKYIIPLVAVLLGCNLLIAATAKSPEPPQHADHEIISTEDPVNYPL